MKVNDMDTETPQGEVFVFGGLKRRMRYLYLDALSFGGFLLLLWPFLGKTGFDDNSALIIGGWITIAFCLHMATIRITLSKMAIISGINIFLSEKFDMDKEKSLDTLTVMLKEKPVVAQLKNGGAVRLSLSEDKSGKILIRMVKAGI